MEYARIMPNPKTEKPLTTVFVDCKAKVFGVTQKLPSDVHTPNTERHWSKNLTTNLLSCLDPLELSHLAASPHLESSAGARNMNLAPVGGASHHSDRMGHM